MEVKRQLWLTEYEIPDVYSVIGHYPTRLTAFSPLRVSPVSQINPPGLGATTQDRVLLTTRQIEAGPLDGVDPPGRVAEQAGETD